MINEGKCYERNLTLAIFLSINELEPMNSLRQRILSLVFILYVLLSQLIEDAALRKK